MKKKFIVGTAVAIMALATVVACTPKTPATDNTGNSDTGGDVTVVDLSTVTVTKAATTPETDEFGVISAEKWKDLYPYEYETYLANASNTPPAEDYLSSLYAALGYPGGTSDCTSALPEGWTYTDADKANYLETNPEIKVLGLGYGYAKYYTEPASHVFSVWTVSHNGRVGDGSKTKAACLSCKSPQWSNYVDMNGLEVNAGAFNDIVGQITENISCDSCHGNDPMTLEVDRAEWKIAMGNDTSANLEGQVCGQCHCDYSMAPGTSIPTSPYDNGREDMVPAKALQWYDDHEFADWTYESTGAKMLAVRHAEYEFNYGGTGSIMQRMGYDCNDCHMGTAAAADGTVYTSHTWISPLDNEQLLADDCAKCHSDLKAEVAAIQEKTMAAEKELGERCVQFISNFEEALTAGTLTDEQISRLQWIQRAACYYWNLNAAENSEGAHNVSLYESNFAAGHALLDEADGILGKSSVAA